MSAPASLVGAERAAAIEAFLALGVCTQLAEAAANLGWKTPSSIQEQAVPHLLQGAWRRALLCLRGAALRCAGRRCPAAARSLACAAPRARARAAVRPAAPSAGLPPPAAPTPPTARALAHARRPARPSLPSPVTPSTPA